jgi:hypothetical protein
MKNQLVKIAKSLLTLVLMLLATSVIYAQDKGLNIDIQIGREPVWYQQTWVMVVGAAVFVLVLVALLKNKSRK